MKEQEKKMIIEIHLIAETLLNLKTSNEHEDWILPLTSAFEPHLNHNDGYDDQQQESQGNSG